MKKIIPATLFVGGLLISASVIARTLEFEITNLTNGMHFTPILVSIHGEGIPSSRMEPPLLTRYKPWLKAVL